MGYIISQQYLDPEIGVIKIVARSNTRSFRARWKGQELLISLPADTTTDEYKKLLEQFRKEIIARKPALRYHDGQQFDFESFSIRIEATLDRKNMYSFNTDVRPCLVRVSRDADFSSITIEKAISSAIGHVAHSLAKELVLDIAADESKRLGIYPAKYTISNGLRTLGRCSTRKEIALSSRLAFLPEHLRRYVVCHELAHLTEMNHSPRFHALVDSYTGGREAAFERELRDFAWPMPK
jgi:predicted metal-dependent hydrolase